MPIRYLVALSVAVGIFVAATIAVLTPEKLSALGSIVAGGGSLLAVLWFSAGLRYQARQLEEQRKQFDAQFRHLQEASRRDSLLIAKDILEKAEQQAIAQHGNIRQISDLLAQYTDFRELKPILESTSPSEVMDAYRSWMQKEGTALQLLSGIKSAAEIYMRSVGTTGVDYSKPPEEFYYIYSVHFSSQPFFHSLSGTAYLLSEFMIQLGPGRRAAHLAFLAASAKAFSPSIIKMDKFRTDLAAHIERGHAVPAIARDV